MKKLWKYIKILITVAVVGYFVYYFFSNKDDFLLVLSTPLTYILLIGLFYSLIFLLNGIFIKAILKSFKKTISVFESFYVSVMSSLGNYFLPMRGGAVLRSVYLKKKFNFAYSHFISTLYGYYIIVFLVNSFLALLALVFINIRYEIVSIPLYFFFGGLFVFMLILSLIKFPVDRIKESGKGFIKRLFRAIKNILSGWNRIVGNKQLFLSLIVITILTFVVHILLFWIEFLALRIESSFISIVLYNCLSGVSLLVSLTPGSLGIREGIFVITSDILGITKEQVMQLALLDRGVMVLILIGVFVILYILERFFKKNEKIF